MKAYEADLPKLSNPEVSWEKLMQLAMLWVGWPY